MSKPVLQKKARILRKKGFGIKTIAFKLGVSSSTVSLWCRDIFLTSTQLQELDRRAHDPYYGRRKANILRQKNKRLETIERLKQEGVNEIGKLTSRELFIAGVSLYWAEGFKKDNRLGFANSDPDMVKFFLNWLVKCCGVAKKDIRFRVGLNISHKDRADKVQLYWSKITGISIKQFQEPYFQKFIWKKDYPNRDEYFGVLRVRVNRQLPLFRKIHGMIDGLRINAD